VEFVRKVRQKTALNGGSANEVFDSFLLAASVVSPATGQDFVCPVRRDAHETEIRFAILRVYFVFAALKNR